MGSRASFQLVPADLAPIFERIGSEHLPGMETDLHRALHRRMRREVIAASPIGTRFKLRNGRRVGPGEYRGSHISSVGPQPGTIDAPASIETLRHGDTSWLGSAAPQAPAIEHGTRKSRRQRSRAGKWYTRIVGSAQAPRGVYFPSRRKLRAVQAQIAADIVRDTDRRIQAESR